MHGAGRRLAWFSALACALVLVAPATAGAVARSFFGVVPQSEMSGGELARMQGVVGVLRVPVLWAAAEPRPGELSLDHLDRTVDLAARSGIRVLPFVYGSPDWLTGDYARPPQGSAPGRAAWSSFLRRLVDRYGPGGTFWAGRQRPLPIRRWQIWNEPNFVLFWRPRPSAAAYARLLAISSRAIRREDAGAEIVTAGVAPVEGGQLPWAFLRRLYRVHGVRRSFDVVGLHPYASSLASLEYQVKRARAAMAAGGDVRTPLAVTEFGVASEGFHLSPMVKTPVGQASFLRRAYHLLLSNRRRWRIAGAYWFTWRDGLGPDPHCVFCEYAGLFDRAGAAKPAWRAFRRVARRATGIPVR